MKKYFLYFLSVAGFFSCTTNNVLDHQYKINGTLNGIESETTIYVMTPRRQVIDSAKISNGNFVLTGKLDEPQHVFIAVDHENQGLQKLLRNHYSDKFEMYLDQREMTLTGKDSVKTAALTGSQLNREFFDYKSQVKPFEDKLSVVLKKFYEASDSLKRTKEFGEKIDAEYNSIDAEIKKTEKAYVKAHVNSLISLDLIKELCMPVIDVKEIEPLFSSMTKEMQSTNSGQELKATIDKAKTMAIGATAPDFSAETPSGDSLKLSDLRGKYLLVDFWASWCGPCRRENPNVVKAFKKYNTNNFTVLGVSLDRTKDAWLKAIDHDGLTWNHVSNLKGWKSEVAQLYMVRSIPQNFLLDPQGKIIAKNLTGEDLEKKLDEVLK